MSQCYCCRYQPWSNISVEHNKGNASVRGATLLGFIVEQRQSLLMAFDNKQSTSTRLNGKYNNNWIINTEYSNYVSGVLMYLTNVKDVVAYSVELFDDQISSGYQRRNIYIKLDQKLSKSIIPSSTIYIKTLLKFHTVSNSITPNCVDFNLIDTNYDTYIYEFFPISLII